MAVDVSSATWEREVIQESDRRPVVVDFWAEWCGPCRMLGPVLEKLERDYDGRFVLAKVNTDLEQNLALKYSVSGIPDVKLFYKGEVQDQFTGAMPEPAVRRFLEGNLPDPALDEILRLANSDPVAAAEQAFDRAIRRPVVEEIIWRAVNVILQKDMNAKDLEAARKFLGELSEIGGPYSEAREKLLAFFERHELASEAFERLRGLVGGDGAALDYFLQRVEAASGDERKRAQEDMLTCFFVLGTQHPLVNEYRRKLSAVLY